MKNVLKYLIEQSLDCLYANDKDLLERKVAERDLPIGLLIILRII